MGQRTDQRIEGAGTTLAAWRYQPVGDGPFGAVAMAHGLSAVRTQGLDRYAQALCDAGLVVLAFDHPGFGDSGGEPRQHADPAWQLSAYHAALAALAADPVVDPRRLGAWGTSYSGGEVLALAAEATSPLRAAVAQVPYLGLGAPPLTPATRAAIRAAAEDPQATIAAVAPQGDDAAVLVDDEAWAYFTDPAADSSTWVNSLTVAGLFAGADHRPGELLGSCSRPLLLLVAEDDRITPPGAALRAAEANPLITVVQLDGGHFDSYRRHGARTAELAARFLAAELAVGAVAGGGSAVVNFQP